ncbi:MAG: ABC transporter permease [Candidatus Thorarchaeota archaeon]
MKIIKALSQGKQQIKTLLGLSRKNFTRSKYRSFLLILGILLTVGLETGIAVSVDTLYDDFSLQNRNQNYTDITVSPISWLDLSSLRALASDVRETPGVAKAGATSFFSVSSLMELIEERPLSYNILIYGMDSETHPDHSNIDIVAGSRAVSGNKILVSEKIQRTLGLEIGEIIDLSSVVSGGNVVNVQIGGIISDRCVIGNKLGFFYIIADIETVFSAVPLTQREDLLSIEVDVSVSDILLIKKTAENIEDRIGLEHSVFVEKDVSDIKATGIRAYQTAMNLVILASFFVEFLFITNVMAISIKDREKEIGILRTVGTKSWQLIGIIGIEILIYALIGSFFGIFVGIGFSIVLVALMDQYYTSIQFKTLSLHPPSLIAIFISGIMVALISGLYPIFLAKTMPVVQNIHSRMRSTKSSKKSGQIWKFTMIAGILLMVTAFALQYFIGPSRFLDFSLLSFHFVSILMIFLGTLLVEAGILVFLPRIAMKIFVWYDIVTRTISMRNIAREFQKSLLTIMTSALALTFIIMVGSLSASIIAEVPDYFRDQWGTADVIAEAYDDFLIPINRTQRLDNRSAIKRSAFIQETRTEINTVPGYIFGVDPEQYSHFAEPVVRSISNEPSYSLLNTSSGGSPQGLVSQYLYQRLRARIGENVSVKIAENTTINIILNAVIKPNMLLGNGEYLYVHTSYYQEWFNSTLAKWFLCQADPTSGVRSFKGSVEVILPEAREVSELASLTKLMERTLTFQTGIFEVLFIESFILAAIAQFVCILVTTLHMEREVGVMRSMGLSKRGVLSIFMSESTALGLTAVIIGLLDGFIGSILLIWYISLSIQIDLLLQLDRIILWVIASFLITLASTIIPSFRSSRKNIVATIQGRPMQKSYVAKLQPIVSLRTHILEQAAWFLGIFGNISFQGIWRLSWQKRKRIAQVVLIIGFIATINFLLDPGILLRSLIPYDVILPLASVPFPDMFYLLSGDAPVFLVNPILLIVGIACISPISSYLSGKSQRRNLIKMFFIGLSWGFALLLLLFIACIGLNVLFFILMVLLMILTLDQSQYYGYYYGGYLGVLRLVYPLFVLAILTFLFHRIWMILVYKGVKPDLKFSRAISQTKPYSSQGRLFFPFLLFIHFFIQVILSMFLLPPQIPSFFPEPLSEEWVPPPLNPLAFLILLAYEIGFYILLILYQVIQFRVSEFPVRLAKERSKSLEEQKYSVDLNLTIGRNDYQKGEPP